MPSRLLSRLLAGAGFLSGVSLLDAFGVEPRTVLVTEHQVALPALPSALEGVRIAAVTDTHLPRNRRVVDDALLQLEQIRPDLIVLVGDICERPRGEGALTAFLGAVSALAPAVGVLGNWEYSRGLVQGGGAARAYAAAGIPLLINQHLKIPIRGSALEVIGLDDAVKGRPNPAAAMNGADPDVPQIWLLHAPGFVDRLPPASGAARLILAGHTHGGQVCLPTGPVVLPECTGRYVAGWYQTPAGPIYVSRGVGTSSISARFFCPPELPVFTLTVR
jgi:predicted MPP superfamily phosphohydrolase